MKQPAAAKPPSQPTVFVVDDDQSIRDALDSLFRSVGLAVKVFSSAADLQQSDFRDVPGCMVLDVRLPGVSGLDFQTHLARLNVDMPVVFMTGHGDIPMSVRAMKAGAVDFLAKPFRDQDMLDAVMSAIDRDAKRRHDVEAMDGLRTLYETLSAREREVMGHVTAGLMNKQIAGIIGLSEITVKIHRGNVMRKMNARSLADLVRKAEALGVTTQASGSRQT